MTRLHYLPSFEDDAVSIWTYIAQHDPRAADRLIDRLYQRCLILEDHPQAGPVRADIARDCRQLVVGPILVLYRHKGERVELVRALDGRRHISPEMFVAMLRDE